MQFRIIINYQSIIMKVQSSVKLICKDCYFVRRGKTLYMRCQANPRHKRRQGFSTLVAQPQICLHGVSQCSGPNVVAPKGLTVTEMGQAFIEEEQQVSLDGFEEVIDEKEMAGQISELMQSVIKKDQAN
ncbi:hypothetical protein FGO68_gene13470 [Halteria grandinella]|uniref:Ribosomal protein n=1 Tax=Halteria grandinella TaxID=5974 RepID=A0A8J8NAE1_HALGN|nr:hypothetical protein FGO68_gene13470 [Halteria grandinella]